MPDTAVRDEGALRMWVCRLPVHIGPLGNYEFAADSRKIGTSCRADVGIGPYNAICQCIRIRRKISVEQVQSADLLSLRLLRNLQN